MAKRRIGNSSPTKLNTSKMDLLESITKPPTGRSLSPGSPRDTTRLALGGQTIAKGLSFGSPSDKGSRSSTRRDKVSSWTSLLSSTSSNGISDLLGGGGLLTAGLDYLTHGIASLFGNTASPAYEPLARFSLPDAQDQMLYVVGGQTGIGSNSQTGVYGNAQPAQLDQSSRSAIIQTVKNAILTSSSLNDVIGEL